MNNDKNIISKHNKRIIRKSQPRVINTASCNCKNKETCPEQNKCMSKDIVYKATISTCCTNDTKHYIGMTLNTFKERFRNHIKSFTHKKYSDETELFKYVWHFKENNTDFTIKWSIIKNSISYTGGSKRCNLCLDIVNRKTDMVRKAGSRDRICYCSLLWPLTSLRRCTMTLS